MRIFLLGTVFIATTNILTAQDLPAPQNREALLRELDQITKTAETHEQQRRHEAISRIQSATASPATSLELYLQALDNTKYLDKHQDFLEWKQKNQDIIRHVSYQNAVQLQLRYLLLGLQRSETHDACSQFNETLGYLNSLQSLHFLDEPYAASPPMKGYKPQPCPSDKVTKEASDLMTQSLSGYPVVEWLQIKDLLPEKDFNDSAGDYFGILEKNVKSPLKKRKDPRLTGVWDLQIAAAMNQANSSPDPQKTMVFKSQKMPQLLFGKSTDTALIGQPNRAVQEMVSLIKTYPENPSVPEWIEAARKLITESTKPSMIGTNASMTATPATSPSPTGNAPSQAQ